MIGRDWKADLIEDLATFPTNSMWPQMVSEAIDRHVPMKEGVAYMPVPRCETCANWTWRPAAQARDGICDMTKWPDGMRIATDCGENTIVTSADFGCVEWKKA